MKETSKIPLLLVLLPIVMAAIAALTASKPYMLSVLFPLIIIVIALSLGDKPTILLSLSTDKNVMYVDDELNIELNVIIHGGFGLLIVRAPPIPNTSMAEGFELVKGNNVHMVFKGFSNVNRKFTYTLRAVKRGNYSLDSIEYTYYHMLGIHEPIKGSIKLERDVQVIPKIKIVRRVLGIVKPRQGLPRYPPSRLGPYSTEFKSVRNYVSGDPYKFINWKATARNPGHKLMVNEYEREGLRTTIILLDVGWWMRHGTVEENPLEYGISLVLSLSRVLLRYGYNVGLWTIPIGPRVIPSSGMAQYYRLLRELMTIRALPIKGYAMDLALYRLIQETDPALIIVTNVNKESISRLNDTINQLPTRALAIDIVPETILMRNLIKGTPCAQWVIRNRTKIYLALPKNVKVITWDPACEGIGSLIAKISTYLGRWL
ncbi:PepX related from Caldicellulosiruptor saccharolyticus [Vulcanisaeta moutnovskia 768-28]|uniref:PepX related from Caldicellulosiruptor saccharolyticus n=1 Tax=Vulcanisaeta moutnovskia (strain 768-28) TaxID=985053 RepID=F0QTV3_VULM7|nr:DUF58 domain-containing protein [Vulcanisaeta moutnovskia]ADY00569.1 PepX related from Caldicellulosiruptor saccharolyticus [Vulcanisaeta moutnovskia 768-28]